MRDPLSVFLHEKVAADHGPANSLGAPRQITKNPDPKSLDPGERAITGLIATGGIAAKVIPWLAGSALEHLSEHGSVEWPRAAPISGSSIGEALEHEHLPRSKMLGLFNVGSRSIPAARSAEEAVEWGAAGSKLFEIRNVVDSFIEKHDLARKGVNIHFQRGPLGIFGPRYHIASKQLYLPRVSKEIALHELGHAADYTKGFGKVRGVLEPILHHGVSLALPIAMIAGDRIKEMLPGTVDDKAIDFMQNHAPAIMGATLAATSLYPEAKASFLAVRHIAQTEGPHAARAALKRLVPAWGTYLLGAVPAVVGMALARKYLRHAREEKRELLNTTDHQELQKTSGVIGEIAHQAGGYFRDIAADLSHVGKQIGQQSWTMIKTPGLAQRVSSAAREVGTSPEFVYGALSAAIPATLGSLYLYGTHSGRHIRNRIHPEHRGSFTTGKKKDGVFTSHADESWREQNPMRFAGLVAAGAALSGGVLAKFISDLQRVL